MFDVEKIRQDFPILSDTVHGRRMAYLDSAATAHKPQAVIDAELDFYKHYNSNVHRGVHHLSELATTRYEAVREDVREFIHATSLKEIIFTSGTTSAINTVAQSFAAAFIQPGDEIIISAMEHHANIVPWQMVCERYGAVLKVIEINELGELDLTSFEKLLTAKTKLIAIAHVSNVLGTINPVKTIIDKAHAQDVPVLLDGAQSIVHQNIDVQELGCDFFVFSGHKLYGPTGVGVLYGKEKWLERMPPVFGGGDMIETVSFEKTQYADLPQKFESGTPNIAGVIALGAAVNYMKNIDISLAAAHEAQLLRLATEQLEDFGVQLIGQAEKKVSVISFVVPGVHAQDVSMVLDQQGVAVRTGHHCAMPLMAKFKVSATLRASFVLYSNIEDVEQLMAGMQSVRRLLM
ncbi:aminotransferase class V-fold PLP-dependent enzyme [Piscirickettsia litoralis]|uniref:Cysteine desulfurase n=1 Tax=Piscirickettsia litoralis TaxID=1891921 RepID=A0ABX2ZZU0_9GAMM|nr:cysteine desulfurase [Piscirickettsia litoralis]ODN42077.1 cysteine desulfurase [Piscirickettsia litoralis]